MLHFANFLGLTLGIAALVVWYAVLPKDDPQYGLEEALITTDGTRDVFITAQELHQLMVNSSTGVTVLDARNKYNAVVARTKAGSGKSVPGSHGAPWGSFTVTGGRGDMKSVPELQAMFRNMGVSNDIPVVVYGSWKEEWGEEGRIFWQLEWLGHKNVRILYGETGKSLLRGIVAFAVLLLGIFGWSQSGLKGGRGIGGQGDFTADPVPELSTDAKEIITMINSDSKDLFLVDSRTESEYDGSTIYNVARGGHIPGAVPFHWKQVFADDNSGNLKDPDELRAELKALGLRDGMKIAAYCTGGIRSGFLYAVLRWLGYSNISNYPGSWWEWAAREDLPIASFAGRS